MYRRTQIRLDMEALRHNIKILREWAGPGFFCPMVKANAYGHGDILVAREVSRMGVSALGVALVEEGLRLREAGVDSPILCFAPLNTDAAKAALEAGITPVIGRMVDLEAITKAKSTQAEIAVHLKFNTGMQRLGFDASEVEQLRAELVARPWLKVEGTCTHFTHGEEADQSDAASAQQLTQFMAMSAGFPGVRHAHKSASLAALKNRAAAEGIGARPGIGIYGLPHEGRLIGQGLRPVMTWQTEITHVHQVEKGEAVSYSSKWIAPRRSVIGVVPMGYGDGYPRVLSNKAQMLCRSRRIPVVGRVCMDYTLLDLTDLASEGAVHPGERVVVLGRQGTEEIPAVEIAEWAGTIAYEIVTGISARVARGAV